MKKGKHSESFRRSLLKTLSWRVVASLTTFLVVFFMTGEPGVSLGIMGVEMIVKTAVYYSHERVWSQVRYGFHHHGHK